MASQNIYDNDNFFEKYLMQVDRSNIKNGKTLYEKTIINSLLPEMNNKVCLDLGCGHGVYSREMVKMGASKVVGIDLSKNMIEKGRRINKELSNEYIDLSNKILFRNQDLESLELEKNQYDVVLSAFVFHYIVKFEKMLETINLSLKKGGVLLFSVEHPIFTCSRNYHDWIYLGKDNDSSTRIWPVSHYSEDGERKRSWCGLDGVIKQHHTVSTYINLLIKTGFSINHVNEWTPSTKEEMESCEYLKNEDGRPRILIIKAIKQ